MNDYRELKSVPLYHHEQVPFHSFQQQQQHQRKEEQQPDPANCDLQDVIFYYQSQPDLLRLILQSKVEEDKRRAEEAKLRAKELDLLMLQQQQRAMQMVSMDPVTPMTPTSTVTTTQQQQDFQQQRRTSLDAILDSPSNIPNLHRDSPSYHSEEEVFSPVSFQMPYKPFVEQSTFPSPPIQRYDPYFPHRPRRRREMQAITKIVETKEYPYVDGYFWKNNGNTIQKKTGNKSVYYKCSNSAKGCPVNKTVTWKENGEYLIKYRGEHLPDCNRVQRVVDV